MVSFKKNSINIPCVWERYLLQLLGKLIMCRCFTWNFLEFIWKPPDYYKNICSFKWFVSCLTLNLVKIKWNYQYWPTKTLKILIWYITLKRPGSLERDNFGFGSINSRQFAVIVTCLDIVQKRLKFCFNLVKAMVFWTIQRRDNNSIYYCWWLPSKLPLLPLV